jgi:hypothetical protein
MLDKVTGRQNCLTPLMVADISCMNFGVEKIVPKLSIPEAYRAGIAEIGRLPDEVFSAFFTALGSAPEFCDGNELSAWMSAHVANLSVESRESILRSLTSMTRAMSSAETPAEDFSRDVWDSLSRLSPDLIVGVDKARLQERVQRLLERTPIDLPSAKSDDLKSEVERNYCDARILTDLRAGFRKTVDDTPSVMVILHNLRIGFHDDKGDHREFYVSLDAKDLRNLGEAVERAKKKGAVLKNMMKIANITIVE